MQERAGDGFLTMHPSTFDWQAILVHIVPTRPSHSHIYSTHVEQLPTIAPHLKGGQTAMVNAAKMMQTTPRKGRPRKI